MLSLNPLRRLKLLFRSPRVVKIVERHGLVALEKFCRLGVAAAPLQGEAEVLQRVRGDVPPRSAKLVAAERQQPRAHACEEVRADAETCTLE